MKPNHPFSRRAWAPEPDAEETTVQELPYGLYEARIVREGREFRGSGLSASAALYRARRRAERRSKPQAAA